MNNKVKALAAVMTGKGVGAISSIQVVGDSAGAILERLFKPAGGKTAFEVGRILVGSIVDGAELIDKVVIGCEEANNFSINCHGNPLIVKMIMELLVREGAAAVTSEELLAYELRQRYGENAIAIEAELAQIKAATVEGAKIIANQVNAGLSKTAKGWLGSVDSVSVAEIARQAECILEVSSAARHIISGCKIVIAGPANSGKSTLLNCLCGRQKAIVADVGGTTRDWVSVGCRIESLSMELFDTAGLDKELASKNVIDSKSQDKTIDLIKQADLVLLVLDGSKKTRSKELRIGEGLCDDEKLMVVFNKSDLGGQLGERDLWFDFVDSVRISAKSGSGVRRLINKIREVLGIAEFDLQAAVCFTERQRHLLAQLNKAESKRRARAIIMELLKGQRRFCSV